MPVVLSINALCVSCTGEVLPPAMVKELRRGYYSAVRIISSCLVLSCLVLSHLPATRGQVSHMDDQVGVGAGKHLFWELFLYKTVQFTQTGLGQKFPSGNAEKEALSAVMHALEQTGYASDTVVSFWGDRECSSPTVSIYLRYMSDVHNMLLREHRVYLRLRVQSLGWLLVPSGCVALSCLVLSCLVLSCLVLSCLVLSCLVLSCLVLS
eukprot:COSAG06_NODE_1181_length_10363_cov_10.391563_13_plen_208_part_01